MHRLLREPLLHFLILGALLFVLYGWLNRGALRAPDEVTVDQDRVEALVIQFERVWQRPPRRDELRGLVNNWVREEILYREGLTEGMDRDDAIVRRRVVQKMSYVIDGMATDVPSETDLQRWLREHPDDYRVAPNYTLRQVYFDPRRHGDDDLASVSKAAVAALERNPQASMGDATLLPATLRDADAEEVARIFGQGFAGALERLPDGRWTGPVASDFGMHLVRIDARAPGRTPALPEVRHAVQRDLLRERSQQASDAYYQALRGRYTVKMEVDLERVGIGSSERHAGGDSAVAGTQ